MKIRLLFLFLILTIYAQAQTSVYHPFPDSAIVWRERCERAGWSCCCTGSAPCVFEDHYQFFINGDTLIGSTFYHKIYKTGWYVQYIDGMPTCPPWCTNYDVINYSDSLIGGIRQDTAARKIYFMWWPFSSQETLLFDFNLNVGDTLPATLTCYPNTNIVYAIDSIPIGSSYHKRFAVSYIGGMFPYYAYLTEGIGFSLGLLNPFIEPWAEYQCMLLCITINSQVVYPDTSLACQLIDGLDRPHTIVPINIYPNPTADIIHIQNNFASPMEVTVFSAYGNVVHKTTLAKDMSAAIDLSTWADGIYLVTGISGKNFISRKLVKQ